MARSPTATLGQPRGFNGRYPSDTYESEPGGGALLA